MKSVTILTLVLLGLLWTFGLATLTVFNYFVALFNDHQVLVTINDYGEYVYETPLIILALPIMLFSTFFCMRLVTRLAYVINLPFKKRCGYNIRLWGFERLKRAQVTLFFVLKNFNLNLWEWVKSTGSRAWFL